MGANGGRLQRLRAGMQAAGGKALLLVRHEAVEHRSVCWLTGFTGTSAFALLTADAAILLTDGRYLVQAESECEGWQVREHGRPLGPTLAQAVSDLQVHSLCYEPAGLLVATLQEVREAVPAVELREAPPLVEELRTTKDAEEVAAIERACAIGDASLEVLLPQVRAGVSERQLALQLELAMRERGAEGLAFPSIVAAGPNSARPHAHPTERPLGAGELMVLDFGAAVDGYCGDMTRTVCVGTASADQRNLYQLVADIQRTAVAGVRAGVAAGELAGAARDAVEEAGFGDYPSHSLGHGIGLQIHEPPWLRVGNEARLQEGEVVTVEPGVYVPNLGGVRIEDAVLVTAEGSRSLTHAPRELLELG